MQDGLYNVDEVVSCMGHKGSFSDVGVQRL